MPFQMIRNDITAVKADAIVNTANPQPIYASGTDKAIYLAAGADQLLQERKKIGQIQPGKVAVTPAFQLQAKYIFHTVGPAWEGGEAGEYDVLTNCYRNCLKKAAELGCESIAFPLIATGVNGFPKDKALQIAIGEITAFLNQHEMQVILVVFDRESFVLSGRVFRQVEELVEEGIISRKLQREYGRRDRMERELMCPAPTMMPEAPSMSCSGEAPVSEDRNDVKIPAFLLNKKQRAKSGGKNEDVREVQSCVPDMQELPEASVPQSRQKSATPGNHSIEQIVALKEQTFREYLFDLIDHRGLKDSEVYKRANLTRQHFSKIRSSEKYHPKKTTVLALAMALELNLDETRELLECAGFALSNRTTFDRLMIYFIQHEEYDVIGEINPILFFYNQPLLGA